MHGLGRDAVFMASLGLALDSVLPAVPCFLLYCCWSEDEQGVLMCLDRDPALALSPPRPRVSHTY